MASCFYGNVMAAIENLPEAKSTKQCISNFRLLILTVTVASSVTYGLIVSTWRSVAAIS